MNTLALFEGVHWTSIAYALAALSVALIALNGILIQIRARRNQDKLWRIAINDDASLTKTAPHGTPLLSALRANGIHIPSPCNSKGTCKQCRIEIDENAPAATDADKAAFDLRQLKKGWRLCCQAKVKGDMHIKVDQQTFAVKEYEATVVSNDNVATFIKELVIRLSPGQTINYLPGSYVQFHVPPFTTNSADWKHSISAKYLADWEKNALFGQAIDFSHLATGPEESVCAFSMASYPREGDILKFTIRIATPPLINGKISDTMQWGICSSYAFSLKPGDTVRFTGPYGDAFMVNDKRDVVFLIGGAGSSFGRSHIMHLFRTEKTRRKVTLWYGARSLKEKIYQDEFEQLAREYPNFDYHLVLSEPLKEDEKAGWAMYDPLKTNMLFRAFEAGQLKDMPAKGNTLFFVCGPPLHNKSVMKLLDDNGVPRENIILDDFGI